MITPPPLPLPILNFPYMLPSRLNYLLLLEDGLRSGIIAPDFVRAAGARLGLARRLCFLLRALAAAVRAKYGRKTPKLVPVTGDKQWNVE